MLGSFCAGNLYSEAIFQMSVTAEYMFSEAPEQAALSRRYNA